MKKTSAESHRILVNVYSEPSLAELTCQKWFLHDLRVVIFVWKTNLKMRNWKHYKDCYQTLEELAVSLGDTLAVITKA